MAEVVIKQIEEGMTGRQVADLLYSNFLALAGAIGSGGGGDIPVADIEKGVTAYGWGDHRQAGYLKGITAGMVTGALGYTPMDEAAWTKANIKATLGIADWALAASKPMYTTKEVAEDGNLYFTDARAVAALAGVTNALAGDIGVLQGYFTNGVAKSAAKLATSRKLWGQSFDGTADVTGALTSVTDITANGTLTIGKIKIGDGVIEWDAANGGFKVTGGLWATDYLSSKGVNTGASGGGGGSSYQRLDTWDGYTSAKDGWVLSAKLGYGLKTTQDDILRQLANITGQGTNVTFTPSLTSGTQIGTLTIDGEPVKMYAPSIPTSDIEKGVTAYGWGDHSKAGYLTQHQDLSGYQTKITSNNKLAASLVSGLAAVATSGKYSDLSGTPTSLPASDVSAWAKAASKPTYKFSEITDKPTTIGGYGITDVYTKAQVDSALGGYLPLSGGTITSSTEEALNIYRASGSVGIKLTAGTQNGWFGFSPSVYGAYLYTNDHYLHITTNGDACFDNKVLIHSGNIGSQSVASATRARYVETKKMGLDSWYGDEYMMYAQWVASDVLKLKVDNNYTLTDRAERLQTARNIWGQSFDGTENVSGALSGVSQLFFNSQNTHGIIRGNLYSSSLTEKDLVFNSQFVCFDGNLGIGSYNPQYNLDVNGSGRFGNILINKGHGDYVGDDTIEMDTAGLTLYMQYYHNGGINMCYGGGAVAMGGALNVKGVIHSNTGIFSDGYVSAKGQNTSSDMRLKRVLEEVTLSVDEIAAAPAFRFAWKGGAGVDVGTSAQYWEKLVPDAVKRDDAGWRMMQYGNVAMVALISLARRVKELEEKLGIKN